MIYKTFFYPSNKKKPLRDFYFIFSNWKDSQYSSSIYFFGEAHEAIAIPVEKKKSTNPPLTFYVLYVDGTLCNCLSNCIISCFFLSVHFSDKFITSVTMEAQ